MPTQKVLIIIPAYNESSGIYRFIREIKDQHPEVATLVINDGSTDDTATEAKQAGASVITHTYNLGIGGAVQTGYKIACLENFDIAVQMDGDAQHDPAYLKELLKPLIDNELDFAIGSRFLTKPTGFQSTSFRRAGIRFFSWLLGVLTGIHLTDPTSGFRAVNRKLIPHFAEYYPVDFPEPEAIKIAKRLNARIGEVPVKMRERIGGVSSIRYFKTVYYMIKVTLAILIDTLKRKPKRN